MMFKLFLFAAMVAFAAASPTPVAAPAPAPAAKPGLIELYPQSYIQPVQPYAYGAAYYNPLQYAAGYSPYYRTYVL